MWLWWLIERYLLVLRFRRWMLHPTSSWISSRNRLHVPPWRRGRFLYERVLLHPEVRSRISTCYRQFHVHGRRDGREIHHYWQAGMGKLYSLKTQLGWVWPYCSESPELHLPPYSHPLTFHDYMPSDFGLFLTLPRSHLFVRSHVHSMIRTFFCVWFAR